jgi:hypothetical protein
VLEDLNFNEISKFANAPQTSKNTKLGTIFEEDNILAQINEAENDHLQRMQESDSGSEYSAGVAALVQEKKEQLEQT